MNLKGEKYVRIKPLQRIVIGNEDNGNQTSRLPNQEEMMDKINQIITVVNELDSHKTIQIHKKFVKDLTSGW